MDTAITRVLGHFPFLAQRGKKHVRVHLGCLIGHTWKCHSLLLLIFHWLEFSHVAMLSCKGVWEM